ncbi:MAG: prepilin-type N-terminal cleavage/methylation domain-containing protein [Planctomycetota bacterium]
MIGSNRRAFSLIEVLAVITIISMVVAAAGLRWSILYERAVFQTAVERIIDEEARARKYVEQSRHSGWIWFDCPNSSLTSFRLVSGKETQNRYRLPQSVTLAGVYTLNGFQSDFNQKIFINYPSATPTYAIQLVSNEQSQWILFAGISGQPQLLNHEKEVSKIFASLKTQGVNTY